MIKRFGGAGMGTVARVLAAFAVMMAATLVSNATADAQARGQVIRCAFTNGEMRSLENGAFQNTPASPLTFDIGGVDLNAQTATLITATGSDQLRIVRAINANHFLEVVTEGFLNMTTVYEPADGSTRSPAVHSRHFGLFGQPIVMQYTGFCEPLR